MGFKRWSPICALIQISAQIVSEGSVRGNWTLSLGDVKGHYSGLNWRSLSDQQQRVYNKEQSPLTSDSNSQQWPKRRRIFRSAETLFHKATFPYIYLFDTTAHDCNERIPLSSGSSHTSSSFFTYCSLSHTSVFLSTETKEKKTNQKEQRSFLVWLCAGQRQTANGKRWAGFAEKSGSGFSVRNNAERSARWELRHVSGWVTQDQQAGGEANRSKVSSWGKQCSISLVTGRRDVTSFNVWSAPERFVFGLALFFIIIFIKIRLVSFFLRCLGSSWKPLVCFK